MADRILIIEDEEKIARYIELELSHEGYEVAKRADGCEGLEEAQRGGYDLILLDIMLPELNGLEVLRRIRAVSTVPVILETARGETIDKINGLNLGADDYIPKPFEIEELLARINALFRRISFSSAKESVLTLRNLKLNTDRMTATISNAEIKLSKTEFQLLKLLLENQGKVLSRSKLIDEIWGKDHFIDENTIDVYIGYLRTKIAEHADGEYIKTVRGVGYIMG